MLQAAAALHPPGLSLSAVLTVCFSPLPQVLGIKASIKGGKCPKIKPECETLVRRRAGTAFGWPQDPLLFEIAVAGAHGWQLTA
jgi:hypothetical protein